MQNRTITRAFAVVLAIIFTMASVFTANTVNASAATKAPKVEVVASSTTVLAGQTTTLEASKNVKWSIKKGASNVQIVAKDKTTCVVKGLKAGSATIKAKAKKGSALVKLTVAEDIKSGLMVVKINLADGKYVQEDKVARIWIPVPQSDKYQKITGFGYEAPNATTAKMTKDSEGNKILFLEFDATVPAADRTAKYHYHVERKAAVNGRLKEKGKINKSKFKEYLGEFETSGSLTSGTVKEYSDKIVKDAKAKTVLAKAKAIFDWQINNLYRREANNGEKADGYGFSGCGRGEVAMVLTTTHGGKCTDLNSTFVALCRAQGIPAREKFGCRLNDNASGGEHCRAEFYLPGTGWVEADPADTLKDLRSKEGLIYGVKTIKDIDPAVVESYKAKYFAMNNNNWVKLAGGRDITLDPAQVAGCPKNVDWERCLLNKSGKINNMGYIYGETDGEYMNTYSPADFGYTMKFMKDAK